MADFNYLYAHRAKFPFGSNNFFRAWGKRLFSFPELFQRNIRKSKCVRKGAWIDKTSEVGEVSIVGKFSFLSVGRETFLGKAIINLHDKVVIGDRVCINDGVQILTASHDISDPEWKHLKSMIIIEDYAWIAINAIILPGVRIGRGAVVGAGAVVSKNVAPGTIVVGNPAKPLQKCRSINLDYNPCEFLAANRAWLKG